MRYADYDLQSAFARQYQARGTAKALLITLGERKVRFSDETRKRILVCSNQEQLERWSRRAVTATSIDEVLIKEDAVDMGLRDRVEVARIQGAADILLEVLQRKGLSIPDDLRDHIRECEDVQQVRLWLPWALAAESVEGFNRDIGRTVSDNETIRRAEEGADDQSVQ